jgi:hypothetical protein
MSGFIDVTGWSARDVQRLGHADDCDEPSKPAYKIPQQQQFAADDVWALAAAVDRINGGYFKENVYTDAGLSKTANKAVVREHLRTNDFSIVTDDDRVNGAAYRRHFTGYTMLAMAGGLNDFQQQAYKVACTEIFTGRNLLEFAIISCLPSIARRDSQRQEIKREVFASEQLAGNVGETVIGDITVMDSRYSQQYEKYRVTGRMGESIVDFWFGTNMSKDASYRIKAKIKAHRDDKTTQFHYVKKIG